MAANSFISSLPLNIGLVLLVFIWIKIKLLLWKRPMMWVFSLGLFYLNFISQVVIGDSPMIWVYFFVSVNGVYYYSSLCNVWQDFDFELAKLNVQS